MNSTYIDKGYLPRETTDSDLEKRILGVLWSKKVIVDKGLGKAKEVKTEADAREWFRLHPYVHQGFEELNKELVEKIEDLQSRAILGLRQIVQKEQDDYHALQFQNLQTQLNNVTLKELEKDIKMEDGSKG